MKHPVTVFMRKVAKQKCFMAAQPVSAQLLECFHQSENVNKAKKNDGG